MMEGIGHYLAELVEGWPEKLTLSTVFGTLSTLLGGEPYLWMACFGMLTADLALGLWRAIRLGEFDLKVMQRGILKFPSYAIYIILSSVLENTTAQAFGIAVPLVDMFLAYLVFTDSVSVLRHLEGLGFDVPPALKAIAVRGKKRMEEKARKIGKKEC